MNGQPPPGINENLLVLLSSVAELTGSIQDLTEQLFILNQIQIQSTQENNLREGGVDFLAGLISKVWQKRGR